MIHTIKQDYKVGEQQALHKIKMDYAFKNNTVKFA